MRVYVHQLVGWSVLLLVGPALCNMGIFLNETHWGNPAFSLLYVLNVLNVLYVLNVLNIYAQERTIGLLGPFQMRPRISITGFVRPSVRPSVHPSVRPSVRPSVCPSVHSFYGIFSFHSLVYSFFYPFFDFPFVCDLSSPFRCRQISSQFSPSILVSHAVDVVMFLFTLALIPFHVFFLFLYSIL